MTTDLIKKKRIYIPPLEVSLNVSIAVIKYQHGNNFMRSNSYSRLSFIRNAQNQKKKKKMKTKDVNKHAVEELKTKIDIEYSQNSCI